jgi:hypothetical protein
MGGERLREKVVDDTRDDTCNGEAARKRPGFI